MARWAMVVDLRKCIGCGTCKEVCRQVNRVPHAATWRRVVDRKMDGNPKDQQLFLTMSCMHCDKPPCLEVCPTGATYRRPDGIVDIHYDLCVGCGSCVVACPYQARSITFEDTISLQRRTTPKDGTVGSSDRIGVCTKCNFCLPRVDAGLAQGLRPGVDPQATPICVRFCIADALSFGDRDAPESEVSRLIRENKTVRLEERLGTEPAVYYIV